MGAQRLLPHSGTPSQSHGYAQVRSALSLMWVATRMAGYPKAQALLLEADDILEVSKNPKWRNAVSSPFTITKWRKERVLTPALLLVGCFLKEPSYCSPRVRCLEAKRVKPAPGTVVC
jgi:hypothetical protein